MADTARLSEARQVLTQQDIDRMVTFLGNQAFRLSHREPGQADLPQHLQNLRPDVERFVTNWHQLGEAVDAIVAHPSEALWPEIREVHVRGRYRTDAATIRRNLREGRLGPTEDGQGWQPHGEYVWGAVDTATPDTPENAHVYTVVDSFHDVRQSLQQGLYAEKEELNREVERHETYGSDAALIRLLTRRADRADRELAALLGLPDLHLPADWEHLHSLPNRHTNRTRFDGRYRTVADLEDQLDQLFRAGRSPDARRRIAELGERRPWELYEYWMVAKMCALLEELRFIPETPSGFVALEHRSGAAYGLQHGASLTFTHEGSGLTVRLTVQNDQAEGQRTDLQLALVGGIEGRMTPLILDAKCKNFTPQAIHPNLAHDLEYSARRYVADTGGVAFLLHPSTLRAWPARSVRQVPVLDAVRDMPFRHGIERLHPDDDRSLRRVLTAWFVRHGVFWVCLSCGESHRDAARPLPKYHLLDFSRRHPWYPREGKHGWVCGNTSCGVGTVLTRCFSCKQLIVKTFPTQKAIRSDNAAWLNHVEIYAPDRHGRPGLRHCAACGDTL